MLSFFRNKGNIDDDDDDNSLSPQKFKKCHIDITDDKDLTNVEAVLISTPMGYSKISFEKLNLLLYESTWSTGTVPHILNLDNGDG